MTLRIFFLALYVYIQPYALCVPIRLSRYIFTFVRVSTALRTYVLTLSGHVPKKSRGDDFFGIARISGALSSLCCCAATIYVCVI